MRLVLLFLAIISFMEFSLASEEIRWQGIIHIYPNWHYVEITVPEGSGDGIAKFQPLADYHEGIKFEHHVRAGSVAISMTNDQILRRFTVTTKGNADNDKYGVAKALSGFSGYVIPPGNALVGYIGSNMDFQLFGSPKIFEKDLKLYLKFCDLNGNSRNRFPATLANKFESKEVPLTDTEVLRWFSKLSDEFPGKDFRKLRYGGELEHCFIRLFHDKEFTELFGKSFDELSIGELIYISRWFQEQHSSDDRRMTQTPGIGRLFLPILGTSCAYQTQVWVLALRKINIWRDTQLAILENLEGEDKALLAELINEVTIAHFWPGDVLSVDN